MEEIYTVHVKCRPNPAQNYPSERAYSSSTVGGLATTHTIIALLVTTLTTAGYCSRNTWIGEFISGSCVVCGALLCALTGILACKRWYIDRNIRWFFIASIISTITSVTSLSLMIFFVIKPTLIHHSFLLLYLSTDHYNQTDESLLQQINNTINIHKNDTNNINIIEETSSQIELIDNSNTKRTSEELLFQIELYVHLLLASLVEVILSMFSLKIGWKGIKNSCNNNSSAALCHSGKPIRPDILENHKNGYCDPKLPHYSNVVKELYKLQKTSMIADNIIANNKIISNDNQNKLTLPLPESQKEYRERIEKFLASHDNCLKE